MPVRNDETRALPTADELLRALLGREIRTVAQGRPNTVAEISGGVVRVKTGRSPDGQPVEVADVQNGLDLLATHGSVRVTVDELGHRSSFVGAVLATLPGTATTSKPPVVTLREPADEEVADDPHFGELDTLTQVKVRTEQARLRRLLTDGRPVAECALCGVAYPVEFLVAAHIKKRAVCSDTERRDFRTIAMLACSMGCDALYESGWITVDATGTVRAHVPDDLPAGGLRARLTPLAGRQCGAHSAASEPYFAWHRHAVFRGGS
ncbi:hypothetical protein [Amycolatopsis sp. cmx-4-61]|uniref:hypothetical protein n=1 Tax=Amycolatopsis sp. cmx-4-61 TaxID=2790937 RepID=UPI0039793678